MPLITRQAKGSKLTIQEMDGNLLYLEKGLRPTAVTLVTESRELTVNDVNKILYNPGGTQAVTLTMPEVSPFKTGDVIAFVTDFKASKIQSNYSGTYNYPYSNEGTDGQSEIALYVYSEDLTAFTPFTGGIRVDGNNYSPARYLSENVKPTPYKVYTALLTQSGGDDAQAISSGALTQGVTYNFGFVAEGEWDFSNVGGPIYPNTNSFVATSSSIPNSFGNQELNYNNGAPVVTVLENTLGQNVIFGRTSAGAYSVEFSGDGFQENKFALFISNSSYNQNGIVWTYAESDTIIRIETANLSGVYGDGYLYKNTFEIRVYN